MNEWKHRCLIVPDNQVESARLFTATLAGASGIGMWTTPLSKTGELPATHWISAGLITAEFASLLPLDDTYFGKPELCAYLANQAGLEITSKQISDLFSVCSVSSNDAFTEMQRLSLVLIK